MVEHLTETTRLFCESNPFLPYGTLLAAAYIGSKAHNTYVPPTNPDSIDDIDIMGVVCPPLNFICGLSEWTHWVHPPDENGMDLTFYSIRKFIGLLLKSNPNVMGFLYLPDDMFLFRNKEFDYLQRNRNVFVSKQVYHSFVGYAHGQLHKMENQAYKGYMGKKRKELVDRFGYDCKNGAHAIRLLTMGIEFLETGTMNVFRTHDAEKLRNIKSGSLKLHELKELAHDLLERASRAYATSELPEHPNRSAAETILMDIQLLKL